MDKEKINAELASASYINSLPKEWHGFTLQYEGNIVDDMYFLYTYANEEIHRSATIYYHDETKEYKLSIRIGQTSFCRMECIAENITDYEKQLEAYLEKVLLDLITFDPKSVSSLLVSKGIFEWEYKDILPEKLGDFSLYISPGKPQRVTNGSYILLDYEDFAHDANFVIYYNIFRDEFFSETHLANVTELNYNFDCTTFAALTDNIKAYLKPYLKDIGDRLEHKE